MKSIVLELQEAAISGGTPIEDLLRMALLVAGKLGVSELEDWARQELGGYSDDEAELPAYRKVVGRPMARDGFSEKPLFIPNEAMMQSYSVAQLKQSISEIHELSRHNEGEIEYAYPDKATQILARGLENQAYPYLACSFASFVAVVDAVRNAVLEWAMRLERDGILGEGLSFSAEEVERATREGYHIENFLNVGNMHDSQVFQASSGATQEVHITQVAQDQVSSFVKEVTDSLGALELAGDEAKVAESDLATIEHQLASPRPKKGVIRESLSSLRNVFEGATGNMIAMGFADQIPALLGML